MEAIDVLKYLLAKAESEVPEGHRIVGVNVPVDIVREIIDAQPERKTGKWIHQAKFGRIECDQCSSVYRNAFTPKNFCPNCGAYMGEGEKDEVD